MRLGWGDHMYRSRVHFFLSFRASSEISLPSPVEMSYLPVSWRARRYLFISARFYPSMPAFIKSSMLKESFYHCGCISEVPTSRERLLSLMNVHVWKIQEGEIHMARAGRLFKKIFPEHIISSLWDLMRSLIWWTVVLFMEPWYIKAWICFFPWVPYRVPFLRPSREIGITLCLF